MTKNIKFNESGFDNKFLASWIKRNMRADGFKMDAKVEFSSVEDEDYPESKITVVKVSNSKRSKIYYGKSH